MHLYRSIPKTTGGNTKIKLELMPGFTGDYDTSDIILSTNSIKTVEYESGGEIVNHVIAIKGTDYTTAEQFQQIFANRNVAADPKYWEINGVKDIGNGFMALSLPLYDGKIKNDAALSLGIAYHPVTEFVDFGGVCTELSSFACSGSLTLKTLILPALEKIDRLALGSIPTLEKISMPNLVTLHDLDYTTRNNIFFDYNNNTYFAPGCIIELPRFFETCNAGAIHPELQIALDVGYVIGWID